MAVDADTGRSPDDARPRPIGIRLLDAVPALRDAVPAEELERARHALVVPVRRFEPGVMTLPDRGQPRRPFAAIIVSGTVIRETQLGGRATGELLGPSDVVETYADDDMCSMPVHTEYVAREPAILAILDDHFVAAARRWPALHEIVGAQQARQVRRASRHLALMGLSRVEDRVMALFCELADRWGRVTPDGIRVDVPLTHSLIGQLVGARRPTVSLALTALADGGALRRQRDGSWLLAPDGQSVVASG